MLNDFSSERKFSVSLNPSLYIENDARDQHGNHSCCQISCCPNVCIFVMQHESMSLIVEKESGRSFPLRHTCQLLMEIVMATIKYFSKTCPQIKYYSGTWEWEWVIKSRGGIVAQSRWTLHHRWGREGARRSLLLRRELQGRHGRAEHNPNLQDVQEPEP